MSKVEYKETGYPVLENSNPETIVETQILTPQYPYLFCAQCQERSFIQPVLPTAPNYPSAPFIEDATHQVFPVRNVVIPYYHTSIPMETQGDQKLVPKSGENFANCSTSASLNTNVITHAANEEETTANGMVKRPSKKLPKTFWPVGIFIVLLIIAAFLISP